MADHSYSARRQHWHENTDHTDVSRHVLSRVGKRECEAPIESASLSSRTTAPGLLQAHLSESDRQWVGVYGHHLGRRTVSLKAHRKMMPALHHQLSPHQTPLNQRTQLPNPPPPIRSPAKKLPTWSFETSYFSSPPSPPPPHRALLPRPRRPLPTKSPNPTPLRAPSIPRPCPVQLPSIAPSTVNPWAANS